MAAATVGLLLTLGSGCSGSGGLADSSTPSSSRPSPHQSSGAAGGRDHGESASPGASAPSAPATGLGDRGERVLGLLEAVAHTSQPPYHSGYERGCAAGEACVFGEPWTDDYDGPLGRNGCDTRQDVLLAQMRDIEMRWGSSCRIYEAWVIDPYTGERLTWRDDGYWMQIDHIYPLAEAWHAGAWQWSRARRVRFANDVRRELLVVSGRANDDKGSGSPAEWLPPHRGFRCTYVTKYLRVARAYDLTVTEADAVAIRRVARGC